MIIIIKFCDTENYRDFLKNFQQFLFYIKVAPSTKLVDSKFLCKYVPFAYKLSLYDNTEKYFLSVSRDSFLAKIYESFQTIIKAI